MGIRFCRVGIAIPSKAFHNLDLVARYCKWWGFPWVSLPETNPAYHVYYGLDR
jgi:hypothetical protein